MHTADEEKKITQRKMVVFGKCPKCGEQVTLANKRKWWKEPDGSRNWYHWNCIKDVVKEAVFGPEETGKGGGAAGGGTQGSPAEGGANDGEKGQGGDGNPAEGKQSGKGGTGSGQSGKGEGKDASGGKSGQGKGENGDGKGDQPGEGGDQPKDPRQADIATIAKILSKHMKPGSDIDEKKVKEMIDQSVQKEVVDRMEDAKQELKKQLSKTVTIEYKRPDTGEVNRIENPHKLMPRLLYHVALRHHVYLWGDVGGGKSTAAAHVAKILGLEFGYVSLNPQTPESRLIGYMDAGGSYRPTVFRNLYQNGGVFCIDEMDNSSAQLLTTLNSLLENGLGAFPDGMIDRHPDFVLVSTGNTNGRGACAAFPDRRPFDQAFAERFVYMEWPYDVDLERKIAFSINPNCESWINFVLNLRMYAKTTYPRLVVSPRATYKGAKYLLDDELSVSEIAESVIFKGFDRDSVGAMLRQVPLPKIERPSKKKEAAKVAAALKEVAAAKAGK